MFVGGEVKHMAFAVGGAILFSGTYSIDFNIIFVKFCMPHLFMVSLGDFFDRCSQLKLENKIDIFYVRCNQSKF